MRSEKQKPPEDINEEESPRSTIRSDLKRDENTASNGTNRDLTRLPCSQEGSKLHEEKENA